MSRRSMVTTLALAAILALPGAPALAEPATGTPAVGDPVAYIGPEGDRLAAVTVEEIVEPFPLYDPSSAPDRGTHYVLVTLTIENTSPRPLDIDPSTYAIQDADGFLSTAESVTMAADAGDLVPIGYDTLEPGARVTGVLVMSVLNGSTISRVVFRPASDRLIIVADLTAAAGPGPVASPGSTTAPVETAGPGPTLGPDPTAAPSLEPGRSAGPDTSLSPAPTGDPFPTAAEAALLEHIPSALKITCSRTDFAVAEESTAAIVCSALVGDGSVTITYQRYDDAEGMDAAYSRNLEFMSVDRDSGACSGEWPAEASYSIDGEVAGRVGCSELGDIARFISWTDDRLLIHGYAEGFGVAKDAFYGWWLKESGPI